MAKPDLLLRSRPLRDVAPALELLTKVVLFHPEPIAKELVAQYCVCRKARSDGMVQCDGCYDWFHPKCVGPASAATVEGEPWKCKWCLSEPNKVGKQRWDFGGVRRGKLRHHLDTPRHRGVVAGQEVIPRYSAPATWDGKVEEIRELARRNAVIKKKLTEDVEAFVQRGGHHLVDAVGMAGLEARPVDDGLVDEILAAGMLSSSDEEEEDEDE